MIRRSKDSDNIRNNANEMAYNEELGGFKTISTVGKLSILGEISAAKRIERGSIVMIFNNSSTVQFFKSSVDPAMSAPTTPATGIPVKPYDYIITSIGSDFVIMGSSANVFAYLVIDESTYR